MRALRLICWASSLLLWLSSSTLSFAGSLPPGLCDRKLDDDIQASVRKFGADYPDPLAWKAQIYQESRYDSDAVSPVGAAGVCQVMPATWRDWEKRNGWQGLNPHIAKYCIIGGQQMMADLRRSFRPASFPDRQYLAQGGYNAGRGNIHKAQLAAGFNFGLSWDAVALALPKVTGKHAAETITYVERIKHWRALLEQCR